MNNLDNKVVVFTDLADYTLKSSLLTAKQLKEFVIDKQDEIILPLIKKYNWKLVKYLWDSYMILFDNIDNSLDFSIRLQKKLQEYNKNIKFNLKKIELKIVLNYWSILRKKTILWEEYFWDTINIASRILEKTPRNRIFITKTIFDKINNDSIILAKLWVYSFKWLVYKIPLYEVVYDKNLVWDSKELLSWKVKFLNLEEKIRNIDDIIFKVSSVAFLLTIQPIPLFDNYFLVLLHIYLLKQIALKYNINLSKKQIKEIISTIFLSIGWIYSTNQLITWLSKIWLPFVWWYLMAPTNFALTYWLWKVFSNYFYYKEQKEELTSQNIKDIFLGSKDKWLKLAKKQKNEIMKIWKEYKKRFADQIWEFKDLLDDFKKNIWKDV